MAPRAPRDGEVGPLPAARSYAAAEVLAESFADDRVYARVFIDPGRRPRALRAFMAVPVRDALRAGQVDAIEAEDELAGVAVWLPPGAYPWGGGRQLRSTPGLLSVGRAAPRALPELMRLGANVERAFPRDEPLWYLEVVGIRSGLQGAGLGTRLVTAGLDRADADGTACYLETSRSENLPFYEHLGFEVEREGVEFLPGAPPFWTMRRPARGA